MPWVVKRSGKCYSVSKPWAVINQKTGKVVACHETEEKAKKQQAALYADEAKKAKRGFRGNPYHVPSGPKGGQFTHKPGGGLQLELPKPSGFSLKAKPLGVGSTLEGKAKDHPTRKNVDRIMQQYGFKNAQQAIDECAAEMDKMITPALLSRGRAWYRDENITAHRRAAQYGVSALAATAVESATSPRCYYTTNQQATVAILERAEKFDKPEEIVDDIFGIIMNAFKLEGAQFVKGRDPDTLTGAKRRSFYNNILFPGKTSDVTVDGRMASVLQVTASRHRQGAKKPIGPPLKLRGRKSDPDLAKAQKLLSASDHAQNMNNVGAGYYILADAVRNIAKKRGESPDTIQSAVWIAIGGEGR